MPPAREPHTRRLWRHGKRGSPVPWRELPRSSERCQTPAHAEQPRSPLHPPTHIRRERAPQTGAPTKTAAKPLQSPSLVLEQLGRRPPLEGHWQADAAALDLGRGDGGFGGPRGEGTVPAGGGGAAGAGGNDGPGDPLQGVGVDDGAPLEDGVGGGRDGHEAVLEERLTGRRARRGPLPERRHLGRKPRAHEARLEVRRAVLSHGLALPRGALPLLGHHVEVEVVLPLAPRRAEARARLGAVALPPRAAGLGAVPPAIVPPAAVRPVPRPLRAVRHPPVRQHRALRQPPAHVAHHLVTHVAAHAADEARGHLCRLLLALLLPSRLVFIVCHRRPCRHRPAPLHSPRGQRPAEVLRRA
mmetsp:Transcript_27527/g.67971  ORF Transcript_27527/g.67971 Transcript_27527/m.67971 type:complete len:357 (-) Transcript_27527:354-1424(-)